jgi:serine/threonine protein kinase
LARAPKQCRDVADYEKLKCVGEGTYGKVFLAKCRKSNRMVALKKLKLQESEGFPLPSVREVTILTKMQHENIVNLVEIVTNRTTQRKRELHKAAAAASAGGGGALSGGGASVGDLEDEDDADEDHAESTIYMVFEYCEFDLGGLLQAAKSDASVRISPHHVRSWTQQLLQGVQYMHKNTILHRDLKPANILIGKNNELKIADWGLARPECKSKPVYTPNCVFTLGFRPLEVFFGTRAYTSAADMWSVGCIFFELLLRRPPFPLYAGQTELDQIATIFDVCGTPKLSADAPGVAADPAYRFDVWPGVVATPTWHLHAHLPPRPRTVQPAFGGNAHEQRAAGTPVRAREAPPAAVDLLEKLLHLNPDRRASAEACLRHGYFWVDGETKRPDQ